MNISFENALGPHAAALQLRSERATLIANNLANADTPNFKARDIDFKAALSSMLDQSDSQFNARIRTTNKGHMSAHGGGPNSPGTEKQVLYRVPSMSSLDGNTVDGQREISENAQNTLQLQAAIRFVDGRFRGLMSAIKGE